MVVLSYFCKVFIGGFLLYMLQNKYTETIEKDTLKARADFRGFIIGLFVYTALLIGSWL